MHRMATEIAVSLDEIRQRQQRVQDARRFQEPDWVPVLPAIAYRYLLPRIGVRLAPTIGNPS